MFNENDMFKNILDNLKINTIMNFKTGDACLDMIISCILTTIISIIFTQSYRIFDYIQIQNITDYFSNKFVSSITIEGKRTFRSNNWGERTSNIWSKNFDAIWYHIHNNIKYKGISSLKELTGNMSNDGYDKTIEDELFIVDHNLCFSINDKNTIYAQITFNDNTNDSDKLIEMCGKVETIKIKIYSYSESIISLKQFIDTIKSNYIKKIENKRKNTIFLYTLHNKSNNDEDCNNYSQWLERPFKSYRTFDNLYFDGKQELINKIDFFINNKEWYKKEGHPYTLGIGISGPPGTGKTSIIKSIANKLNRHLIQIPLNKINSEEDFYNYYFESTYNKNNETNSITFEEKILVLEDIDCMSDIILDRSIKRDDDKVNENNENNEMLEKLVNVMSTSEDSNKKNKNNFTKDNNKLTLSFILNLLDGLDENYGRILIMTSNYYDNIDKALVRPGRIDIKLEMKNASIQTIKDMYNHYYGSKISNKYISQLKDNMISPAEIVKIYRSSQNAKDFIETIIEIIIKNSNF